MSTSADAPTPEPDDATPHADGSDHAPLEPAKAPVSPGTITALGVILALVVTAAGVVGLQTAAAASGLLDEDPWLTQWIDGVNGLEPRAWMPVLAVLLVAAGLWLLLVALRPRPRTAIAVRAQTGVFIGGRDLTRLLEHAAADADGVVDVSVGATRAKVSIHVSSTGAPEVRDGVTSAVRPVIEALEKEPKVTVSVKEVQP